MKTYYVYNGDLLTTADGFDPAKDDEGLYVPVVTRADAEAAVDRQAREIVEALRARSEVSASIYEAHGWPSAADFIESRFAPKEADPPRFCSRCDGYGVVANNDTGKVDECPECNGRRLTNAQVRAAKEADPHA